MEMQHFGIAECVVRGAPTLFLPYREPATSTTVWQDPATLPVIATFDGEPSGPDCVHSVWLRIDVVAPDGLCLSAVLTVTDGVTFETDTRGWRDGDGGPICVEGFLDLSFSAPGERGLRGVVVLSPASAAGPQRCESQWDEPLDEPLVAIRVRDMGMRLCGRDPGCADLGDQSWEHGRCVDVGRPIPSLVRRRDASGEVAALRTVWLDECCQGFRLGPETRHEVLSPIRGHTRPAQRWTGEDCDQLTGNRWAILPGSETNRAWGEDGR